MASSNVLYRSILLFSVVLRQVDEGVFQSDFTYARDHHSEYDVIISVAVEHSYPWNTLHIPQADMTKIDFWDLLRVSSLVHVSRAYNKKVLIYCNAGLSRSVAYSLAYLVSKGMTLQDAKKHLNIFYPLHPSMEDSLRVFESRLLDPFFSRLFRYELVQMEALENDTPALPLDRAEKLKEYVPAGSRVLILGCTRPEHEAFSRYFNVECVHLNPLGKVGKFMMFEYNGYPDSYFDAVVAFDTLEHMYAPFIVVGEIRRVLKDGGIFYHTTPTVHDTMKIPWHVSLLSPESWKWVFEWWDFRVLEEKLDTGRITQVLKKEKYMKYDSYHRLVGIS